MWLKRVHIKDIYINDNELALNYSDKEKKNKFYLKGVLNKFELEVNDGLINIENLIEENLEEILKEEEYRIVVFDENDNEKELYYNQYNDEITYICKNKKIDNVLLDVFSIKSQLKINIKQLQDKKVTANIVQVVSKEEKILIAFEFSSKYNISQKKMEIFILNDCNENINISNITKKSNFVTFEITSDDLIKLNDGEYKAIFTMDGRYVEIVSEDVSLNRILSDRENNYISILSLKGNENGLNIEINTNVNLAPILLDINCEGNTKINGKLGLSSDVSRFENINIVANFTSENQKINIQKDISVEENDNFTIELTPNDFNRMYKEDNGLWNISLILYKDNEEVNEVSLKSFLNKNCILERGKTERKGYVLYNQIVQENENVSIKFNNSCEISKIVNIELGRDEIRFRLRTVENITQSYGLIDLYILDEERKIKADKIILKGKKTIVAIFKIDDVNKYVSTLIKKGVKFEYIFNCEKFLKTLADIDEEIIRKNIKDRIFKSGKYKRLCKKLYLKVFMKLPLKEKVMFESFLGRNVSGNPKYIYEYMVKNGYDKKYKLIWILNDLSEEISGQGKKVKRKSMKYYYHMATSKYWIFNTRQADEIIKRNGNIYLQTWHGTPLKRLGMDMDSVNMAGQTDIDKYKAKFEKNVQRWDYLLSQNDYSTEIFRRAFAFKKEMMDFGYPANDPLYLNNNKEDIETLKKKLNLPLDKKVILYAPTWRDNNYLKKGYYKMQMQLDLEKITKELGDEYIILLRMHYLIMNAINIEDYEGVVYDFSQGYDIQELYLVSDILITDYSSVMFDYSNLNRPLIFFAYDIEEYRDSLRGFYFDFEEEAPGPIVKTTKEVIKKIKNIEKVELEYKDNKEKFNDKFCHIDDGTASEKIVKKLFG